jgi:hypothetical protein
MTPYELHIALHYHTRPCDLDDVADTDLLGQTLANFVNNGLLTASPKEEVKFRPTDRLHAFCEMLQHVPLPVQAWTDPRDEEIVRPFVPTAGEL